MLTFKEGLLQFFSAPHLKGALLLTPTFSCVFYMQQSGAGFRHVEDKEKLAARVTLIIFLLTGCVHKSDVERIPSSFSICPKLGLSELQLKKRHLKSILVWY